MLADVDCKNATCPPGNKRRRLSHSGGLYLEVSPAGSKRWFWKFYPDVCVCRTALVSLQLGGHRHRVRMGVRIDLRVLLAFATECHHQLDGQAREPLEVVLAAGRAVSSKELIFLAFQSAVRPMARRSLDCAHACDRIKIHSLTAEVHDVWAAFLTHFEEKIPEVTHYKKLK